MKILQYFNLFAHDTSKDDKKTKVKFFLYNNIDREDVILFFEHMETYNDLCYKKIALLYYKEKVKINNIAIRLNYSTSNIKKILNEINLSAYSHFFINDKR